jgi:hypothetical protein
MTTSGKNNLSASRQLLGLTKLMNLRLFYESETFFVVSRQNNEIGVKGRWPPLPGSLFVTPDVMKVQPEKVNETFTDISSALNTS